MLARGAGLADADIDALFADATDAEAAGKIEDALASLTIAIAELHARNRIHSYPFEWLARLHCELGDPAAAESSLLVARKLAEAAERRRDVYRMDVARARVACAAHEVARAHDMLAGLRGDGAPLGPPTADRLAEIARWIRWLMISDRRGHGLAVLQAETALTIAELWAEQGKYRSARELIDELRLQIAESGATVRAAHVELLRAEWLLAAGEFAAAEDCLAQPGFGDTVDPLRIAVVRARAALLQGRLAKASGELELLNLVSPKDPKLFACAVVLRVAVQLELNLTTAASETAAAAIAKLDGDPRNRPLIALLDNARRVATSRGRSAIALWELPVLTPGGHAVGALDENCAFEAVPEPASRFTAAWTAAANRVLLALERGDLVAAIAHHAELEQLTQGAESSYIAARVSLSAALIEYYRTPDRSAVEALLRTAVPLHRMGARLDEAQAMRFASWASARVGRTAQYARLARVASEIIDEIAGELDPVSRTLYMMNKWNGRDEFVAGRMKELLAGDGERPRRPARHEILRAFHDVEALTSWPIDEAFGVRNARRLAGNATADMVMGWLADRLSSHRSGTGRDFGLRSAFALWWFPARTLVLHYHVLPDRTYLFRIARRHLDVVVLPVGRVHLRIDMRGAVDDREQLAWLAARLGVADAVDRFPGIHRLVIVAHDAVANVPFAVLPVRDGALCERVAICQLDRLSRLLRNRGRGSPGRFVAVGLSSYAGSGHADLPDTEAEAQAVAAALGAPASQLCVGPHATCEGVQVSLPGATHMHIAAHGLFDHTHPADSGVVLRNGPFYRTLTLHELRRLDLRQMQLATLATCRSAESAQLPGRERICLPTALLDAGARGVIASLWPVEDQPSVEIMRALYHRLRSEPPATALARMQAERRHTDPSARNWAGLVFYGNE